MIFKRLYDRGAVDNRVILYPPSETHKYYIIYPQVTHNTYSGTTYITGYVILWSNSARTTTSIVANLPSFGSFNTPPNYAVQPIVRDGSTRISALYNTIDQAVAAIQNPDTTYYDPSKTTPSNMPALFYQYGRFIVLGTPTSTLTFNSTPTSTEYYTNAASLLETYAVYEKPTYGDPKLTTVSTSSLAIRKIDEDEIIGNS